MNNSLHYKILILLQKELLLCKKHIKRATYTCGHPYPRIQYRGFSYLWFSEARKKFGKLKK